MALAAAAGLAVQRGGPGGGVAAVVGEGGQGVAGAGVGRPAEVDRAGLARLFGDGAGAGLGGGVFGVAGAVQDGPTSARIWAKLTWPMRGMAASTAVLGWAAKAASSVRSRSAMLASRTRNSWTWAATQAASTLGPSR